MAKQTLFGAAAVLAVMMSLQAQDRVFSEPDVLPTGKFATASRAGAAAVSPNGTYSCTYTALPGTAERFAIGEFSFFRGSDLLYSKPSMPGNSFELSNAGLCAAFDVGDDSPEMTVRFFGPDGTHLMSKTAAGATLCGFSENGTRFGIGREKRFELVDPAAKTALTYGSTAWRFGVSSDGRLLALAGEGRVSVFEGEKRVADIPHELPHIRAVTFSIDNRYVGFIGKNRLFVHSLPDGAKLCSDRVEEPFSFCDIRFGPGGPLAGIQCRDRKNNELRGILRRYDRSGKNAGEEVKSVKRYPLPEIPAPPRKKTDGGASFPWPFKPQDEPCKVWNGYLALSTSEDGNNGGAYCHQGLDLDVPAKAPTCSVADGYVKARLSTGGDLYWRVAVSEVQTADSSEAWLYAHLIQSSITVDVGDKVKTGDVLGEIIAWPGLPGGHIHFSRLRSRGTVWSSWRNFCNPQLLLTPEGDTIPPQIQNAFSYSKFGFCTNDTVSTVRYLRPDSLKGRVDFLAKIRDVCGESPWTQPATSLYYRVRCLRTNKLVFPRTMALMRNQGMPDYAGSIYEHLAKVMYRVDGTFPAKCWFTKERLCVHVLTNNNGDSAIAESESKLAFDTKSHPDGNYRLTVEAFDAAGNRAIDSQDVFFRNGIIAGTEGGPSGTVTKAPFGIGRCVWDGRGVAMVLRLPDVPDARLSIVDIAGRTVRVVASGPPGGGCRTVRWDGSAGTNGKASTGIYIAVLSAGTERWSARVRLP